MTDELAEAKRHIVDLIATTGRTVRLAALEEAAMWHEKQAADLEEYARDYFEAENDTQGDLCLMDAEAHKEYAKPIRALIDQTGGEGGI